MGLGSAILVSGFEVLVAGIDVVVPGFEVPRFSEDQWLTFCVKRQSKKVAKMMTFWFLVAICLLDP